MFLIGSFFSSSETSVVFAKRTGLFGTNSEQQSWSGSIDVLKVPMDFAIEMISGLLYPIKGRNIGNFVPALIAVIFCIVCELTWPKLSPVRRARAFSFKAIFWAILR